MTSLKRIEQERIDKVVNAFAVEMKAKLFECVDKGKTGWDNKFDLPDNSILQKIQEKITVKNPETQCIDIANYAMFLWYRKTIEDENVT